LVVGDGLGCAGYETSFQMNFALHLQLVAQVARSEACLLPDAFKVAAVVTLVDVNATAQGGAHIEVDSKLSLLASLVVSVL
jgi:hypothetical protein